MLFGLLESEAGCHLPGHFPQNNINPFYGKGSQGLVGSLRKSFIPVFMLILKSKISSRSFEQLDIQLNALVNWINILGQSRSVCHWGLSFPSYNSFFMVFSKDDQRVFQVEMTNSRDGRSKQIQKDLYS